MGIVETPSAASQSAPPSDDAPHVPPTPLILPINALTWREIGTSIGRPHLITSHPSLLHNARSSLLARLLAYLLTCLLTYLLIYLLTMLTCLLVK